jgi:hypothetical protein
MTTGPSPARDGPDPPSPGRRSQLRLDGIAFPSGRRLRRAARSGASWAGYAWFMTLGTILPLPTFLAGYALHLTQIGARPARAVYRLGIFLSTLGLAPPGADRVAARQRDSGKKPLVERIRPYSPPGRLARRERPVGRPLRVVWFVLVGWWLGAVWVVLCWSLFLLPYPMLDAVRALLAEIPSVMTLAPPE